MPLGGRRGGTAWMAHNFDRAQSVLEVVTR